MAIFKAVKGDSENLAAKEFHDGHAYLTTDDGKLYFDALDGTEQKRILINPDQEQADWNQNDPEQKDYIKNRICYREGDEIVYVPDAEYPIVSSRGVTLLGSFVIPEEGTVCKVVFGDLEVEKKATLSGSTIVVGDDYSEFIITFRSEQEIYVETQRSANSVRVSVKKYCVYHKIDPEYLPDAFKDGEGIVKPKDLVGQKSSKDGTGEVFNDYKFNSAAGYAHAEGANTNASGLFSHTEGVGTVASGENAHAEGQYTTAASLAQHVQGKYNVEDADGKYAHIVGNGNWPSIRSNAHTIDWAGNAWFSGDVLVGGTGQDDPNASKLMKDVVGSETQFIGFDKNGVAVAKDLTHYESEEDFIPTYTIDSTTEIAVDAEDAELVYLDGITKDAFQNGDVFRSVLLGFDENGAENAESVVISSRTEITDGLIRYGLQVPSTEEYLDFFYVDKEIDVLGVHFPYAGGYVPSLSIMNNNLGTEHTSYFLQFESISVPVIKKIDEKFLPKISGSYNQFVGFDNDGNQIARDLTHYDDSHVITFDGNTEGLDEFDGYAYKVSDLTPSKDEIIGSEVEIYFNGVIQKGTIAEEDVSEVPGLYLAIGEFIIVLYFPFGPFEGMKPGIYFAAVENEGSSIFVKSLKYGNVKTLDDRFLPPSVQDRFDKKQDIITTSLVLQDLENGYKYSISMRNGNLVSAMCLAGIKVTSMPTEMSFMNGSKFDPTGVVISAIDQVDGSEKVVEGVTYMPEYVSENTTVITAQYTENGVDYYADIPITVTDFDAETVLIDFEYTKNDDGTYTLTAWKETLNGEPSTECVVPDNELLVIDGGVN